jgi:hypothetical protein
MRLRQMPWLQVGHKHSGRGSEEQGSNPATRTRVALRVASHVAVTALSLVSSGALRV